MNGKTIRELAVGDKASFSKTVSEVDVYNFAGVTGDFNPAHIDQTYAENSLFKKRIAHGILSAGFISTVIGTKLPGPGAIYLKQNLKFTAPVYYGDTITAEVEVIARDEDKNRVTLKTTCRNQDDKVVIEGEALVMPPRSN